MPTTTAPWVARRPPVVRRSGFCTALPGIVAVGDQPREVIKRAGIPVTDFGFTTDATVTTAAPTFTDFENFSVFKPADHHEKSVTTMLDQVVAWGGAMKTLRAGSRRG